MSRSSFSRVTPSRTSRKFAITTPSSAKHVAPGGMEPGRVPPISA
jgi:hypothetical protein